MSIKTSGSRGSANGLLAKIGQDKPGVTALVVLLVIAMASLCAGVLTTFGPNSVDLSAAMQGPGLPHVLGTDSAGRDTWTRLLFGGRTTLSAAAIAATVAIAIGVPAGLVAGYYGRHVDAIGTWVSNMLLSLPAIVVLLAARAALGPSVWVSMVIFGALASAGFFRVVRASVQQVRGELFIDAARVSGLSDKRIIGRHVLGVVRAPIIIQGSMTVGVAIGVQAGLDFLGLGDPSVATWGMMLNEGFRNIYTNVWLTFWPALAITVTVTSFVFFGNAVRDAFEDRSSAQAELEGATVVCTPTVVSVEHAPTSLVTDVPPDDVSAPALLSVTDLSVGYSLRDGTVRTVLESVSFSVLAGETLGIVGESGSGKTQIAFSILGLLPPQAHRLSGAISMDGFDITGGVRPCRANEGGIKYGRDLAYIPQEPMSSLDPAFTIGYQLVRPIRKTLGLTKAAATRRAVELLDRVGIDDPRRTMSSYPHEISGGMAQRVLIAGAVSCDPRLLVADEPTTALDVTVQAEVLDLLRDLQHEMGMGLVMVTHNFGVVADLCQRVLVMQSGRAVETGSTVDVLSAPQHPYTRQLLSSMLEGRTPKQLLGRADRQGSSI